MRKKFKPHKPDCLNGNLYYVRLKTELGILYKLGFTSLQSASERLNYQSNDSSHSIDEVIFFNYYENAWSIEQKLHQNFKKYALFSGLDESMPLFRNGQSELYAKDILEIDLKYNELQMEEVLINIEKTNLKQYNFLNDEKITLVATNMKEKFDRRRAEKIESLEHSKNFEIRHKKLVIILRFIFNSLFYIIDGIFKIAMKLLGSRIESVKNDDIKKIIEQIQNEAASKRDEERILRQAKMNALLKEHRDKERLNNRL